jgi:hypothetical protein
VSVAGLVVGQPIVFDGVGFGNLVSGVTYYVASVDTENKKITVSATYLGSTFTVIDANGNMRFTAGGTFGNVEDILANGLARTYYIVETFGGNTFQISDSPGGLPIQLTNSNGIMRVNRGEFQVSLEPAGTPVSLSTASGTMTVNYANDRMAIWTVTIGLDGIFSLTLDQETVANEYVTSSQGQRYAGGTLLYRPVAPGEGLLRVSWLPLITTTTVVSTETTFDENSVQWVEPVDMYTTSDANDKYLVFPKAQIVE